MPRGLILISLDLADDSGGGTLRNRIMEVGTWDWSIRGAVIDGIRAGVNSSFTRRA